MANSLLTDTLFVNKLSFNKSTTLIQINSCSPSHRAPKRDPAPGFDRDTHARDDARHARHSRKRSHMQPLTLELTDMQAAANQACRLMKVLANPDRLMILCQLSQGERRVGELETLLGIVQPTLSQQLTVLRDEALVSTRRDGKHIYYRIDSPQAQAVIQSLYEHFCGSGKE
jgi:DNA-binding transcriptional ArsR family regulator